MTAYFPVWVVEPWMREDGVRFQPGMRLVISADYYRKWAGLDYFARDFRRCRHWSGREYLHAVSPCGALLYQRSDERAPDVLAPPEPIHFKFPEPPKPPAVAPRVVAFPLPLPPKGVIRRGCGGCVKRMAADGKA